MASSTATHTISEYDIGVSVETDDGRINVSSGGKGVASINMSVNRASVGALNALQFNPLVICFTAQAPEAIDGTKKYINMAMPIREVAPVKTIQQFAIEISTVPGFPVDLTTELFDINALDEWGGLMVATVQADGTLVGDIDPSASSYDSTTGACKVTFLRPLKQGQAITYIKRFTSPPSSPLTVSIPNLVPYQSVRDYTFVLPVIDRSLGRHFPISEGTVTITAISSDGTTIKVTDGGGALAGAIDASGTNTINYETGETHVTFSQYLKEGTGIMAEWASKVEVVEYKSDDIAPTRMKVSLNWEDLARIVKSVEQAADAAEATLKYRADT